MKSQDSCEGQEKVQMIRAVQVLAAALIDKIYRVPRTSKVVRLAGPLVLTRMSTKTINDCQCSASFICQRPGLFVIFNEIQRVFSEC